MVVSYPASTTTTPLFYFFVLVDDNETFNEVPAIELLKAPKRLKASFAWLVLKKNLKGDNQSSLNERGVTLKSRKGPLSSNDVFFPFSVTDSNPSSKRALVIQDLGTLFVHQLKIQ